MLFSVLNSFVTLALVYYTYKNLCFLAALIHKSLQTLFSLIEFLRFEA